MDHWFSAIATETHLSPSTVRDLRNDGFAVIPGPLPAAKLAELTNFYDQAVLQAHADDIKAGGSTTRVTDFVNRIAALSNADITK